MASVLPKAGQPQRRTANPTPNHAPVVLLVEAGGTRVPLGADLEHNEKQGEGWLASLGPGQTAKSQIFKVPRHGPAGADHPNVWTEMLSQTPLLLSLRSQAVTFVFRRIQTWKDYRGEPQGFIAQRRAVAKRLTEIHPSSAI
jgi:hypothetical protein